MPKFHDRKSLCIGILTSIILSLTGLLVAVEWNLVIGLFQAVFGMILSVHCFDMLRYYKSHRIVRIVKTDTERLIYKQDKDLL